MDVEQLAVNRITDLISRCPRLRAHITLNDKTPFTDGHIDIYRSSGQYSKADFIGRVPVQVKGRSKPPRRQNRPSFQITRTDLSGYLRESGILYFVAYIDKDSGDAVPYYVNLSPFKIDALLRKAKPTTQNISVKLTHLPLELDRLEALLRFALRSRREDLTARASEAVWKNLQSITLYTPDSLDFSRPQILKQSELDFSIFVRTTDGMELPADGVLMIAPQEYVGIATDYVVRTGKREIRNPIRKQIDESTVELILSAGLRITLRDPCVGGRATVSLDLPSNLGARISDVGFFLDCMVSGGFHINDKVVEFRSEATQDLSELRAHYEYLERVRELFEHLDADTRLVDLDTVSPRQLAQLTMLHAALVGGEEVEQDFDAPGRVLQPLGDWTIELLCVRGEQEGKWRYVDLFGIDSPYQFSQSFGDDSPEFVRITPYEMVDVDHLPRTLNLHLPNVVDAFAEVADYPEAITRATAMVLRLIGAADEIPRRRAEFLRAANDLNEWLITKDGAVSAHRINDWQIAVRLGQLTDEQRADIRDLKHRASGGQLTVEWPLLVEIACAILLDDPDELNFLLSKAEPQHRELLTDWPVWTLHEQGQSKLSLAAVTHADDAWRRIAVGDDLSAP